MKLFIRKQCTKCGTTVGLLDNHGTTGQPLCLDCAQAGQLTEHTGSTTLTPSHARRFLAKFMQSPSGAAELLRGKVDTCTFFYDTVPDSFHRDFSRESWHGPLKLVVPGEWHRRGYFFVRNQDCSAVFRDVSAKLRIEKQGRKTADSEIEQIAKEQVYRDLVRELDKGAFVEDDAELPHPRWDAIAEWVEKHSDGLNQHALWHAISLWWLEKLYSVLGGKYFVHQTSNFLVFSSQTPSFAESLGTFLERTLRSLHRVYSDLAIDEGYGRWVVLVFEDQDQYYRYISHFYPGGGTFGMSSGVFLDRGYGHFVFPFLGGRESASVAAHELTHACIRTLRPPHWLNESMAVAFEKYATGSNGLYGDIVSLSDNRKLWEELRAYWHTSSIQDFWTGSSFSSAGDGQKFSYILSDILFNLICEKHKTFKEFAYFASVYDSGSSAARLLLGEDMGQLVASILGEGDWEPSAEAILEYLRPGKTD